MASLFLFEVYTPYRVFFSDSVEAIVLTLLDGEAAVYANHSHFTAPVIPCLLKIKDKNGVWKTAFTSEGLLEVTSHKTVLLSDTAEWPEEIDSERAKEAKERAEETLKTAMLKFETDTAAASLKRADMRLKVSNKT
jgi:F-type H+-transporting ATPase subunit epsilon